MTLKAHSRWWYQENLIEFLLDLRLDFILLYMVCAHYWLSGYPITHYLILSLSHVKPSRIWSTIQGTDPLVCSQCPSQVQVHHLLSLQSLECLPLLRTCHIILLWGLANSWQLGKFLSSTSSVRLKPHGSLVTTLLESTLTSETLFPVVLTLLSLLPATTTVIPELKIPLKDNIREHIVQYSPSGVYSRAPL